MDFLLDLAAFWSLAFGVAGAALILTHLVLAIPRAMGLLPDLYICEGCDRQFRDEIVQEAAA